MIKLSQLRGFNYQPSWGSSGFEIWQNFNAELFDVELSRGRKYFPRMDSIRLWLSWDSFIRNPRLFAARFETALATAAKYSMKVMPVLFNRWHDSVLDYGGIYIDHFLPAANWVQRDGQYDEYLDMIVGGHATDARIFSWDLCNEPFSYLQNFAEQPIVQKQEQVWLTRVYEKCKALGATAPLTVGTHMFTDMSCVEAISDVISIHPYLIPNLSPTCLSDFQQMLDKNVAIAERTGKALIATETCWGRFDDGQRVDLIRQTLTELKQRNIGWMVYLLHHSLIADAHRPEHGPVGYPEYLAFIEADGSLRAGHGIFNEM